MKNLVLGTTVNYSLDKVKPFILSLRKNYNDRIILVTDRMNEEFKNFYDKYNVEIFLIKEPVDHRVICVTRFKYYLDLLKNLKNIDNVFISDIRDVIFQKNPFETYPQYDFEFFAEPELMGACPHNGPWYRGLYGDNELHNIKDKYVLCAGTTMAKYSSMIFYIEELLNEMIRLFNVGLAYGNCDQAAHIRVVYTGKFKNFRINENGKGLVSTMHHSKILRFNREGQLLNDDNSPTPVVHQYDRCGAFSMIFLKNCFSFSKKDNIIKSAEYIVNNFDECNF